MTAQGETKYIQMLSKLCFIWVNFLNVDFGKELKEGKRWIIHLASPKLPKTSRHNAPSSNQH